MTLGLFFVLIAILLVYTAHSLKRTKHQLTIITNNRDYWLNEAMTYSDEANAWCETAIASTYKRDVLPENVFLEAAE